jgi:hypothetical protein
MQGDGQSLRVEMPNPEPRFTPFQKVLNYLENLTREKEGLLE